MNYLVNIDDMCMKYQEYFLFLDFHTCYFNFVNLFIFPIKELINFSNYGINIILFIRIMSARG